VESRHPRPGGRILSLAVLGVALMALLQGCASNESVAQQPELLSSGWSDLSAMAPVADFDAYDVDVTRELRVHRLPFDAAAADAELASVAPFRIPPGPGCTAVAPRGTAVLVHGLSNTAFAMRDLAGSLSRLCFESRVLLLPGHGTRPADLRVVDHQDWLAHVKAAVAQAGRENDRVVLAGFSLGAALVLTVAAESPDKVDAVIGLSPAYRLSSNFLARQARWVAAFRTWLDLGPREDFARYGAMPTRGIASTTSGARPDGGSREASRRGAHPLAGRAERGRRGRRCRRQPALLRGERRGSAQPLRELLLRAAEGLQRARGLAPRGR
jgi:pimeloyl-ACP methyl ester carboxylesterase